MKTITIGCSTPHTFKIGAKLIQWWIKRPYSHIHLRYIDDSGYDMVFEASQGSVHLITYQHFIKEYNIIESYDLSVTDKQYNEFRDFYYDKLGMPYNFMDIIRILLHDLGFKDMGIDTKGYVCSELAARLLTDVLGYKLPKSANLMTPADVEELLRCKCKV